MSKEQYYDVVSRKHRYAEREGELEGVFVYQKATIQAGISTIHGIKLDGPANGGHLNGK